MIRYATNYVVKHFWLMCRVILLETDASPVVTADISSANQLERLATFSVANHCTIRTKDDSCDD